MRAGSRVFLSRKIIFLKWLGNVIPLHGRDPERVIKVEERLRELVAAGVDIARADAVARSRR